MTVSILAKTDFAPRSANDAARHFAKKAALTDDVFASLSAAAKRYAFRVAGVHKAHLIQDVRDKILAAIEKGTNWSQVQRELLAKFDTEGVPRPALHRLKMMFTTNAQQAYNDARRDVLDDAEISEAFPFRQYLTVGNGVAGVNNVRAEHAALHGKVFAWDDPFWDEHTPPWGFNCRCTFVALTAGQVKGLGVKVLDLDYVRTRIPVPGTNKRGIAAQPEFARGGTFDLSGIDAELRSALERMIGT